MNKYVNILAINIYNNYYLFLRKIKYDIAK